MTVFCITESQVLKTLDIGMNHKFFAKIKPATIYFISLSIACYCPSYHSNQHDALCSKAVFFIINYV